MAFEKSGISSRVEIIFSLTFYLTGSTTVINYRIGDLDACLDRRSVEDFVDTQLYFREVKINSPSNQARHVIQYY